jgi:hypothetical protein
MRTTLTLDDDVAAQIERLRKNRDISFKDVVNDALRRGLREITARPKRREPFRTRTYSGSKALIENVDNIAEVLALVEGDDHK